ncbi:hypothetical protein AAG570_009757 [Ranatra chinensis]|uniref:Uncharacterized protein n=1 Tax=Ranatra chinensis TaxID=642074 RepID=A0ABD0YQ49_9HEMI
MNPSYNCDSKKEEEEEEDDEEDDYDIYSYYWNNIDPQTTRKSEKVSSHADIVDNSRRVEDSQILPRGIPTNLSSQLECNKISDSDSGDEENGNSLDEKINQILKQSSVSQNSSSGKETADKSPLVNISSPNCDFEEIIIEDSQGTIIDSEGPSTEPSSKQDSSDECLFFFEDELSSSPLKNVEQVQLISPSTTIVNYLRDIMTGQLILNSSKIHAESTNREISLPDTTKTSDDSEYNGCDNSKAIELVKSNEPSISKESSTWLTKKSICDIQINNLKVNSSGCEANTNGAGKEITELPVILAVPMESNTTEAKLGEKEDDAIVEAHGHGTRYQNIYEFVQSTCFSCSDDLTCSLKDHSLKCTGIIGNSPPYVKKSDFLTIEVGSSSPASENFNKDSKMETVVVQGAEEGLLTLGAKTGVTVDVMMEAMEGTIKQADSLSPILINVGPFGEVGPQVDVIEKVPYCGRSMPSLGSLFSQEVDVTSDIEPDCVAQSVEVVTELADHDSPVTPCTTLVCSPDSSVSSTVKTDPKSQITDGISSVEIISSTSFKPCSNEILPDYSSMVVSHEEIISDDISYDKPYVNGDTVAPSNQQNDGVLSKSSIFDCPKIVSEKSNSSNIVDSSSATLNKSNGTGKNHEKCDSYISDEPADSSGIFKEMIEVTEVEPSCVDDACDIEEIVLEKFREHLGSEIDGSSEHSEIKSNEYPTKNSTNDVTYECDSSATNFLISQKFVSSSDPTPVRKVEEEKLPIICTAVETSHCTNSDLKKECSISGEFLKKIIAVNDASSDLAHASNAISSHCINLNNDVEIHLPEQSKVSQKKSKNKDSLMLDNDNQLKITVLPPTDGGETKSSLNSIIQYRPKCKPPLDVEETCNLKNSNQPKAVKNCLLPDIKEKSNLKNTQFKSQKKLLLARGRTVKKSESSNKTYPTATNQVQNSSGLINNVQFKAPNILPEVEESKKANLICIGLSSTTKEIPPIKTEETLNLINIVKPTTLNDHPSIKDKEKLSIDSTQFNAPIEPPLKDLEKSDVNPQLKIPEECPTTESKGNSHISPNTSLETRRSTINNVWSGDSPQAKNCIPSVHLAVSNNKVTQTLVKHNLPCPIDIINLCDDDDDGNTETVSKELSTKPTAIKIPQDLKTLNKHSRNEGATSSKTVFDFNSGPITKFKDIAKKGCESEPSLKRNRRSIKMPQKICVEKICESDDFVLTKEGTKGKLNDLPNKDANNRYPHIQIGKSNETIMLPITGSTPKIPSIVSTMTQNESRSGKKNKETGKIISVIDEANSNKASDFIRCALNVNSKEHANLPDNILSRKFKNIVKHKSILNEMLAGIEDTSSDILSKDVLKRHTRNSNNVDEQIKERSVKVDYECNSNNLYKTDKTKKGSCKIVKPVIRSDVYSEAVEKELSPKIDAIKDKSSVVNSKNVTRYETSNKCLKSKRKGISNKKIDAGCVAPFLAPSNVDGVNNIMQSEKNCRSRTKITVFNNCNVNASVSLINKNDIDKVKTMNKRPNITNNKSTSLISNGSHNEEYQEGVNTNKKSFKDETNNCDKEQKLFRDMNEITVVESTIQRFAQNPDEKVKEFNEKEFGKKNESNNITRSYEKCLKKSVKGVSNADQSLVKETVEINKSMLKGNSNIKVNEKTLSGGKQDCSAKGDSDQRNLEKCDQIEEFTSTNNLIDHVRFETRSNHLNLVFVQGDVRTDDERKKEENQNLLRKSDIVMQNFIAVETSKPDNFEVKENSSANPGDKSSGSCHKLKALSRSSNRINITKNEKNGSIDCLNRSVDSADISPSSVNEGPCSKKLDSTNIVVNDMVNVKRNEANGECKKKNESNSNISTNEAQTIGVNSILTSSRETLVSTNLLKSKRITSGILDNEQKELFVSQDIKKKNISEKNEIQKVSRDFLEENSDEITNPHELEKSILSQPHTEMVSTSDTRPKGKCIEVAAKNITFKAKDMNDGMLDINCTYETHNVRVQSQQKSNKINETDLYCSNSQNNTAESSASLSNDLKIDNFCIENKKNNSENVECREELSTYLHKKDTKLNRSVNRMESDVVNNAMHFKYFNDVADQVQPPLMLTESTNRGVDSNKKIIFEAKQSHIDKGSSTEEFDSMLKKKMVKTMASESIASDDDTAKAVSKVAHNNSVLGQQKEKTFTQKNNISDMKNKGRKLNVDIYTKSQVSQCTNNNKPLSFRKKKINDLSSALKLWSEGSHSKNKTYSSFKNLQSPGCSYGRQIYDLDYGDKKEIGPIVTSTSGNKSESLQEYSVHNKHKINAQCLARYRNAKRTKRRYIRFPYESCLIAPDGTINVGELVIGGSSHGGNDTSDKDNCNGVSNSCKKPVAVTISLGCETHEPEDHTVLYSKNSDHFLERKKNLLFSNNIVLDCNNECSNTLDCSSHSKSDLKKKRKHIMPPCFSRLHVKMALPEDKKLAENAKEKTENVDDKDKDYGVMAAALLNQLPKGGVIKDSDMQNAIGVIQNECNRIHQNEISGCNLGPQNGLICENSVGLLSQDPFKDRQSTFTEALVSQSSKENSLNVCFEHKDNNTSGHIYDTTDNLSVTNINQTEACNNIKIELDNCTNNSMTINSSENFKEATDMGISEINRDSLSDKSNILQFEDSSEISPTKLGAKSDSSNNENVSNSQQSNVKCTSGSKTPTVDLIEINTLCNSDPIVEDVNNCTNLLVSNQILQENVSSIAMPQVNVKRKKLSLASNKIKRCRNVLNSQNQGNRKIKEDLTYKMVTCYEGENSIKTKSKGVSLPLEQNRLLPVELKLNVVSDSSNFSVKKLNIRDELKEKEKSVIKRHSLMCNSTPVDTSSNVDSNEVKQGECLMDKSIPFSVTHEREAANCLVTKLPPVLIEGQDSDKFEHGVMTAAKPEQESKSDEKLISNICEDTFGRFREENLEHEEQNLSKNILEIRKVVCDLVEDMITNIVNVMSGDGKPEYISGGDWKVNTDKSKPALLLNHNKTHHRSNYDPQSDICSDPPNKKKEEHHSITDVIIESITSCPVASENDDYSLSGNNIEAGSTNSANTKKYNLRGSNINTGASDGQQETYNTYASNLKNNDSSISISKKDMNPMVSLEMLDLKTIHSLMDKNSLSACWIPETFHNYLLNKRHKVRLKKKQYRYVAIFKRQKVSTKSYLKVLSNLRTNNVNSVRKKMSPLNREIKTKVIKSVVDYKTSYDSDFEDSKTTDSYSVSSSSRNDYLKIQLQGKKHVHTHGVKNYTYLRFDYVKKKPETSVINLESQERSWEATFKDKKGTDADFGEVHLERNIEYETKNVYPPQSSQICADSVVSSLEPVVRKPVSLTQFIEQGNKGGKEKEEEKKLPRNLPVENKIRNQDKVHYEEEVIFESDIHQHYFLPKNVPIENESSRQCDVSNLESDCVFELNEEPVTNDNFDVDMVLMNKLIDRRKERHVIADGQVSNSKTSQKYLDPNFDDSVQTRHLCRKQDNAASISLTHFGHDVNSDNFTSNNTSAEEVSDSHQHCEQVTDLIFRSATVEKFAPKLNLELKNNDVPTKSLGPGIESVKQRLDYYEVKPNEDIVEDNNPEEDEGRLSSRDVDIKRQIEELPDSSKSTAAGSLNETQIGGEFCSPGPYKPSRITAVLSPNSDQAKRKSFSDKAEVISSTHYKHTSYKFRLKSLMDDFLKGLKNGVIRIEMDEIIEFSCSTQEYGEKRSLA